jgi:hypothetical protein
VAKGSTQRENTYSPPSAPRWKGTESLALVHQLNERCLTLLCTWAASADSCKLPLIAHHRGVWSSIGADVVERAARFPFLILELHFANEEWWRKLTEVSSDARPEGSQDSPWPPLFAEELLQEILIFAWHTVRWDRRVGRLSLGASPGVAESIAELTPRQLAVVAQRHNGELRLRWQDDTDFWSAVLRAARSGNEEALTEIHRHAKLLLCGELLSRAATSRTTG